MKRILIFFILIGIIPVFLCESLIAQRNFKINNAKPWTVDNVFNANVFIENLGQFDNWAKTTAPIKFAVNNSDIISFSQQGLTFRINKINKREEAEINTGKDPDAENITSFVNLQWEDCNPNAVIEVSGKTENYYTFAEKGYEKIQAKGYSKLLYKELYPGIDLEYIIPDKGGIKYSIILHPGADLSLVKMKYTGNIERIEKDSSDLTVRMNDIAQIKIRASKPLFFDTYKKNNITGSVILIDEATNETVGAGMIV